MELHLLDEPLGLLGRDLAGLGELLRVERPHARMARDPLGHQRLRERGLVALVVAVPPVADEIDDDVAAEAPPEREREPDRRDRGLGIVGVDVDDRGVEAFREVARIARRAPVGGIGGEADLVVGDHVQRAAGRVADEALEVERLRHDALRRERRVPVDQDGERDCRIMDACLRRAVGLLGSRDALDDRVDRLEVARVGREHDRGLPGAGGAAPDGAEVVLDVSARSLRGRGDGLDRPLALELAQDLLVGAVDDVREDVEPAPVRHADHDLVRARFGSELDGLVEHRHEHVEALDRELLLPEEGAPQVVLEALDLGQPPQEPAPLVGRESGFR